MDQQTKTAIAGLRTDVNRLTRQLSRMLSRKGDHVLGQLDFAQHIQMAEIAAPDTPGTGKNRLYFKSDAHLYSMDDAGSETDLTTGIAPTGAPGNCEYLVLTLNATLTGERRLVAGTGLSGSDAGANGDYTLSVAQGEIDHGNLAGLGGDDHPQYAQIAAAETVTGAWTFEADPQLDADLDFVGAQSITTSAGDLTIAPAGDLNVDADLGFVGAQSITTSAGNLTIAPTGDLVLDPNGNDVLPNTHRDLNIGGAAAWFASAYIDELHAGTIKTVVFETDVINVFNGSFMVAKSSASLASAKTFAASGADTFTANDSGAFSVGDILRLKDVSADVWLTVTGIGSDPTINVTVSDEDGDRAFAAGTPVVNYGASGQGLILFTANDLGDVSAPGISIFSHAGSPWSAQTEHVRIGNLNGGFGIADDYFGFGVGDYSGGDFIRYETDGGFLLSAGSGDIRISGSGLDLNNSSNHITWSVQDGLTGAGYVADDTVVMRVRNRLVNNFALGQNYSIIEALSATGIGGSPTYPGILALVGESKVVVSNSVGVANPAANGDLETGTLALRSSDVAHGATDIKATDIFGALGKSESDAGGLLIQGLKDADGVAGTALDLRGYLAENANTAKTTAGYGIINMVAYQTSGTGLANTVADGNLLSLSTQRGGSTECVFLVDEDGDIYYDGSASSYDAENDLALVRELSDVMSGEMSVAMSGTPRAQALGIIGPDGRMISSKREKALYRGAILQLEERIAALEKQAKGT